MFSGQKKIEFTDRTINVKADSGADIGISSLSSGEKQVLLIFIETLMAEKCTLLLDEPEISLHIDWQRNLIYAMRELNAEAQLILATHAPEIMAEIPDKNIFKL